MSRAVINLRDDRPSWTIPQWALDEIRAAIPERFETVVVEALADSRGDGGAPTAEAIEAVRGAEIYLGYGFPEPLLSAARESGDHLRWVHSGTAGVRGALSREMVESDIILTNSAGIHGEPIADTVMGMVYHFARGFDFAVRAQSERKWGKAGFDDATTPIREIEGSVIGIVGFGGIGRAVGRRAIALGMRVLAHRRRSADAVPGIEVLHGDEGLARLLRESHYVVLTLPHTTETNGLLDRPRIATLRGDAVVINVGRGEVVDEPALAEALAQGRIRGAGLDVFATEPLPPASPLWDLPNVLITPHVSATTPGFWRRQVSLIVENLGRYERGEPLRNMVDKRAGY